MRKLIAVILALALLSGLACAFAEEDNFLISDWKLVYTYDGSFLAEYTVFIYEDNTFEIMDENESKKGTWTFDGETLVLTGEDDEMILQWDEEAHQFLGEYNSMAVTMSVPVEPESGDMPVEAPGGGMLAGGWDVAEDQTITDDINNILFQALDSFQTGIITVAYTPVALLGTQTVAGTNYAVLCKASEINAGSSWVIIYLYQDLEGNASVLDVTDVVLGVN